MQLGLVKALYTDELKNIYSYKEAENIFYIALQWLEKKSKTAVILGQDTLLVDTYRTILKELQTGKPIQYITNEAPFYGVELFVDDRVLIPRPETEQLVHWILQENPDFSGNVLDIGTGSGCIPITLAKHWPKAQINACDHSTDALAVAKENATRQNVEIAFMEKDILTEGIEKYDLIISNPPYISQSEKISMHKNVLEHEPHNALFVEGADSLIFYKRIIELAENQNTTCYFETSEHYRVELDNWLISKEYKYNWQLDFQEKNRMLKVSF